MMPLLSFRLSSLNEMKEKTAYACRMDKTDSGSPRSRPPYLVDHTNSGFGEARENIIDVGCLERHMMTTGPSRGHKTGDRVPVLPRIAGRAVIDCRTRIGVEARQKFKLAVAGRDERHPDAAYQLRLAVVVNDAVFVRSEALDCDLNLYIGLLTLQLTSKPIAKLLDRLGVVDAGDADVIKPFDRVWVRSLDRQRLGQPGSQAARGMRVEHAVAASLKSGCRAAL